MCESVSGRFRFNLLDLGIKTKTPLSEMKSCIPRKTQIKRPMDNFVHLYTSFSILIIQDCLKFFVKYIFILYRYCMFARLGVETYGPIIYIYLLQFNTRVSEIKQRIIQPTDRAGADSRKGVPGVPPPPKIFKDQGTHGYYT